MSRCCSLASLSCRVSKECSRATYTACSISTRGALSFVEWDSVSNIFSSYSLLLDALFAAQLQFRIIDELLHPNETMSPSMSTQNIILRFHLDGMHAASRTAQYTHSPLHRTPNAQACTPLLLGADRHLGPQESRWRYSLWLLNDSNCLIS